ncbi:MAG: hypothetical protein V4805_05935 [Pseudomonadota bacterium]
MKVLFPHGRVLAAITLTLGLTACGGYSSVTIGGNVTGLSSNGLVLANGDRTVEIPANANAYLFPGELDIQATYAVTIKTQPKGLTCVLTGASGSVNGLPVSSVNVSCIKNSYALGGTISGLTSAGLVLANGSDTVSPAANSTGFTFAAVVPDGNIYGVAVLAQPSGQTCTVANYAGTMGGADVTNIQVNCQ